MTEIQEGSKVARAEARRPGAEAERLAGRPLERETRVGVEHFRPGQHFATIESRETHDFFTPSVCGDVGRITYVDQMGHLVVVLTWRDRGSTEWRATWVGRTGMFVSEEASQVTDFPLSPLMLAALRDADSREPEPLRQQVSFETGPPLRALFSEDATRPTPTTCLKCGNRSVVAHGGGFRCRDCGKDATRPTGDVAQEVAQFEPDVFGGRRLLPQLPALHRRLPGSKHPLYRAKNASGDFGKPPTRYPFPAQPRRETCSYPNSSPC